ncbi:cyclin-dependent protein kinase inhibitor SMR2-like [Rutidosis leptorrhynchoides]|uniref:cyclin-dependent protein kinase inhibitor SMR2-like n=1 Tax=Rutidosis leptorrhynchoides TaxID=125765 RepID=UPI003A9A64ED
MSTDLQFRQPPIDQLPSLTISIPQLQHESSTSSSSSSSSTIDPDQSECVTPTSPEHRIPAILACPPPPRKQRRFIPSCKRRLHSEFQFFEVVARDEIDSFFKSSYELIDKHSSKKRR